MKKIKLLLATTMLCFFFSCSDENKISNDTVEKSMGLRTVLNNIKKTSGSSDRTSKGLTTQSNTFYFDFVYPITLSYNNGTTITVTSYEGLIEVLTSENENLYIEGISFPFQIVLASDGSIITINNEDEFWEVLDSLEIETMDDYIFSSLCYEFVFPFSILNQNNETVVIANENELLELFTNPNSGTMIADFVYPFSVIYNDETIAVTSAYEFFELNNLCLGTGCICPTVYDPVCVATPGGVLQFSNACLAECSGFTPADFINCNPNEGSGFELLGTCFTINYPIQVQYQGAVYTVNTDDELIGYLNASGNATVVYPIVINHATSSMTFTIENQTGLLEVVQNLCF
jgi:hypothetical protein